MNKINKTRLGILYIILADLLLLLIIGLGGDENSISFWLSFNLILLFLGAIVRAAWLII